MSILETIGSTWVPWLRSCIAAGSFFTGAFILEYVDIDVSVYISAPDPLRGSRGDGQGDSSSSWLSTGGRYISCCPFSFPAQCTRRKAAGMTFRLPDGRYVWPPSVPVRHAVCSRVFDNSGPDGSRDRAVARMRGKVLASE